MLQIYLYGPKEEGFLDLGETKKLEIEEIADAFDEDFRTGKFSLPEELPWTDNNRRLTGFAERIENGDVPDYSFKVDVLDNGWPEIVGGQLSILERAGSFTYKRGHFSVSISGSKGLFGTMIANKKMTSLTLGGVITWTGVDSRHFANDLMHGSYPQYPYIAFAPVAIESFFDKDRFDYNQEFLAKDTVNNVMLLAGLQWAFARPQSAFPLLPAVSGTKEYQDYRSIPFFNLKYVLQQIFAEFGYDLFGDFIGDSDFDEVFLYNNFSLENYTNYVDSTRQITPGNHMPDMLITDWLKNFFSFFNIYPSFYGTSVKLTYRVKQVTNRNPLPVTPFLVDNFDATISPDSRNKGYKLSYNWDSNDQYHSERVKDIEIVNGTKLVGDKKLVATVATFANLQALNIGRQLLTSDCVLVQADNMFYSLADGTVTPKKWDAYAEYLPDYIQKNKKGEDPGRNITLGMAPLANYVLFNETTGLKERMTCVAISQKGSYITASNTRVKNPFGQSIFYIKKRDYVAWPLVPMSFNNNRNSANQLIEKYSLSLNGTDGIAINFHTIWQNLQEKGESIKTSLIVDKKLKEELDQSAQIECNGVHYLVTQSEPTIPQTEPMPVYLLPL